MNGGDIFFRKQESMSSGDIGGPKPADMTAEVAESETQGGGGGKEEKQRRDNKAHVQRFLSLSDPQLTPQMVPLFSDPNFFSLFLEPLVGQKRPPAVHDAGAPTYQPNPAPNGNELAAAAKSCEGSDQETSTNGGSGASGLKETSVLAAPSVDASSTPAKPLRSISYLPLRRSTRDADDADGVSSPADTRSLESEALRQSYWVATVLCNDVQSNKLLSKVYKEGLFCSKLLAAFRPESTAWIPHISALLSGILKAYPESLLNILSSSETECAVHFDAICSALHHPLVRELLQNIICLPVPKPGKPAITCDPKLQKRLSIRLAQAGVLKRLVEYIVSEDVPFALSDAAAETFTQALKRISTNSCSVPLSNSLKGEVQWIVEHLCESLRRATAVQQEAAKISRMEAAGKLADSDSSIKDEAAERLLRLSPVVSALTALVAHVMPSRVEAPSSAPYQSFGGSVVIMTDNLLNSSRAPMLTKMSELRDIIFNSLLELPGSSPYLVPRPSTKNNLNESFTYETRHPGHVTSKPFSEMRLNLVRIIFGMIKPSSASPSDDLGICESVPVQVWHRLSQWLVEYPHTNMYHNIFVDLFSVVLASNCEPALRAIMKRPKKKKKKKKKKKHNAMGFLSRIIRHYNTAGANSSVRGHILKCLNMVRLKVQSVDPNSFLAVYVRDLQDWREFLPTLIEQTLLQQRKYSSRIPKPATSMFHLSPNNDADLSVVQEENIDLGSTYADQLGLGNLRPWSSTDVNEA